MTVILTIWFDPHLCHHCGMVPTSIADQLFYTTVYITGWGADGSKSTGTGFIVEYRSIEGGAIYMLVTNKHVLDGFDRVDFSMVADAGGVPTQRRVTAPVHGMTSKPWHGHPDPDVDVAVMPFSVVLTTLSAQGLKPFFCSLSSNTLLSQAQALELDAIEDATFVGYPNGLFDPVSFLPVVRRGQTATPLQVDYQGKPSFLIDAAVFPGSSGSPVLLFDRNGYNTRNGGFASGTRVHLLGVLAAVHTRVNLGELIEIPTRSAAVLHEPIGLGIVYKASAIQECVDAIVQERGVTLAPGAQPLA